EFAEFKELRERSQESESRSQEDVVGSTSGGEPLYHVPQDVTALTPMADCGWKTWKQAAPGITQHNVLPSVGSAFSQPTNKQSAPRRPKLKRQAFKKASELVKSIFSLQ